MKKRFLLILITAFVLAAACSKKTAADRRILVVVSETNSVSAEDNGRLIYPGQTARFTLSVAPGYAVTGTDYAGVSRIYKRDGKTILELENVEYPLHVAVTAVSMYRTIKYDANGGETLSNRNTEKSYNVSTHSRPNTETGQNLFTRSGYTLTAWNTKSDGTGEKIGLGSRVTVPESGLTLYAVWEEQTDAGLFTFEKNADGLTLSDFGGKHAITGDEGALTASSVLPCYPADIIIPDTVDGLPVTAIKTGAFEGCGILSVVIPSTVKTVEDGAFSRSALTDVTLFDNIEYISDAAFEDCKDLRTLHINAVEAPFGYLYRRESVYADKVDLLINAHGKRKLVLYGGCSMWYNLLSVPVQFNFGADYVPVNMGINGTVNGHIQMQIIEAFIEEGDVIVHAPEISGEKQLLTDNSMGTNDSNLWCGIENNYDLFALVDLKTITGVFDSLCNYLSKKDKEAAYDMTYHDSDNNVYMDSMGCIPFYRERDDHSDTDRVDLDSEFLANSDLSDLISQYGRYSQKGASVIVSYSCVNIDAVPEAHRENITATDMTFHGILAEAGYPVISNLWDYIFHDEDFSDTNYHLTTPASERYTSCLVRDLKQYFENALSNATEPESGVK